MTSRLMLLLRLAVALELSWMVEQPVTSLMVKHPRFQELLGLTEVFRQAVHLGAFGASSSKPIHIYSNSKARRECFR